ncbi:hypothetical protein ES705_17127 [subsurface metagenome]
MIDNCTAAPAVIQLPAAGSVINGHGTVQKITLMAEDDNGNIDLCTFDVTLSDTISPGITCPADVTVNVDAGLCIATGVALGTPATADNCSVASVTNDATEPYAPGNTTVTWTVTDGSGNTATCTQTVTVIDNIDPTIICPSDINQNSDPGVCDAYVTVPAPVTSDNCPGETAINSYNGTADASDTYPVGTTVVTWTVTDGYGNFSTCIQNITINDNENPSITCPADRTEYVDASCNFTLADYTGLAVVIDNCTAAPAVIQLPAAGTVINGHGTVQMIILMADDGNGNTDSCTFDVTLSDTISPTISCIDDQTRDADAGEAYYTVVGTEFDPVSSSDNCSVAGVINDINGGVTIVGEQITDGTTITWSVTDGAGNTSQCSFTITVNVLPANPGPITASDDTVCPGQTGVVYYINSVEWATSYSWTVPGGATIVGPSNDTSITVAYDLTAVSGNITVVGVNENGNSPTPGVFAVTVNPLPPVTLTSSDSDCTICVGDTVTFTAGGGVTFEFFVNGISIQGPGVSNTYVTGTLNNGDTINVEITVANGCSNISTDIVFTVNSLPVPTLVSDDADNIICSGDTITFTAGGGNEYEFYVNGLVAKSISTDTIYVTDSLSDGDIVTVEVFDTVTGCSAVSSGITNTVPPVLVITPTIDVTLLCYGDSTATGTFRASGGTAPYAFTADVNTAGVVIGTLTATDISFTNGGAGEVTVTVIDNNGCSATATITITQPAELILGTTGDIALLCYGDSTAKGTFTVSGGPSPYVFTVGTNTAGAVMGAPAATGISFTNGGIGIVVVTVTNADGCTASDTIFVTEPLALALNHVETNVSCNGGSDGRIDITVSGGTTNYTYSWSNGATTEDVGNLSSGTYTVTVTDANGCTLDSTITISEPPVLVINHVDTDATCNSGNDGAIDITVTGGTGVYTYVWSNGPTSEDVNNLTAGNYTVTVTDANSCTLDSTFTINEPAAWIVSVSVTDVACYGESNGQATVTVTGGVQPYNYLWFDGQTGQTAGSLSAGDYAVTIIDVLDCARIENVTIFEPLEITTDFDVTDASCPEDFDGAIILTISSGIFPYTVLWSDGSTIENLTNIAVGTYIVMITDATSCTKTDSVTVGIIGEDCVTFIPSVITPNDDGKNDVWIIDNIELYPNTRVEIFDRWGKLVYVSKNGYRPPWNGKYNGKDLPMDSYHYIIDFGKGSKPKVGTVTIIR